MRRERRAPLRRRRGVVVAVVAVAVVIAGAVAAVVVLGGDDDPDPASPPTGSAPVTTVASAPITTTAPPTTAPPTTLAEGTVSVFDLAVGDCFDEPTADELVVRVPEADCAEPHDHEVFHLESLPDGEAPADEEIAEAARQACLEPFAAFVGLPWIASSLDYRWLAPTAESWADGDREVVCFVSDPAGPVTGTLAGAAR